MVTATLRASFSPHFCSPSPLQTSPPYCFSLGAWQHPSRWRVYFCFCLFTYSCIQLFGASQGLSFHHRMQIATAANPLSSLPCRHPATLHISSQSLAVRTSLLFFFSEFRIGACCDQASLTQTLVSTWCLSNTMHLSPTSHP